MFGEYIMILDQFGRTAKPAKPQASLMESSPQPDGRNCMGYSLQI
jgi:hypothetical protein